MHFHALGQQSGSRFIATQNRDGKRLPRSAGNGFMPGQQVRNGTYIEYLTAYAASRRSVSRIDEVAECDRPSPCISANPRRGMLRAAFSSA